MIVGELAIDTFAWLEIRKRKEQTLNESDELTIRQAHALDIDFKILMNCSI